MPHLILRLEARALVKAAERADHSQPAHDCMLLLHSDNLSIVLKVLLKCALFAVAMSNGERVFVVGSARRRRERRLLCFLRHEEMVVRMALARSTHHAVQRHQCTQTVTPAATCAASPAPLPVIDTPFQHLLSIVSHHLL